MNQSALRNRWNSDPRQLTLRMMEAAIYRASQNVIDVFCLWNSKTNTWERHAPTLLKLTHGDICIYPMDERHIALSFDAVNTEEPYKNPQDTQTPFVWKSLKACSYTKGRRISSFTFGTSEKGLLTALEAHFNDGGHLTIDALGCNFCPVSRRAKCSPKEAFLPWEKSSSKVISALPLTPRPLRTHVSAEPGLAVALSA